MVALNVLAERLWKIIKNEKFVKNLMEFHLNGMLFFRIISSFFEWIYKQTFAKNLAKFGQKTSSSLILHSKRVVKFSALQHYVQKWYVTWFRTKFLKFTVYSTPNIKTICISWLQSSIYISLKYFLRMLWQTPGGASKPSY